MEQLKAYILLYISSKSTRKSTHSTRLCGVAQGLHIAIYRPKALVNLHTAQDLVECLKAYILLYISSKSTRKSTHSTRLCGVAQGLHIAIYRPKALVNLHTAQDLVEWLKAYVLLYISSKSTRKSTHGTRPCGVYSSRPTYCYIYRPKALVNLHTAQDLVEWLKAYILLYIYRPKVLVNLHTAQDLVEWLKAYILLYILSKSTRKSTHGTRLCGVAQGLHIAIYIVQKHS